MATVIKWRDSEGKYQLFDNSEITAMSRDHAISLFSGGIPVIAAESGTYITNSESLSAQYRQSGKRVMMFSELVPSDRHFGNVGFLGE